jgi:arabinosaccharide transport system substrate-binding protein
MRNIYPFGKAPFVILIIAIVSGIVFCGMRINELRKAKERPDLIMSFQAEIHEKLYKEAVDKFVADSNNFIVDEKTGELRPPRIVLQRVQKEVLQDWLQAAMQTGYDVPDLVELLEGTIGFFTRGRIENVGFVDLTEKLRAKGLLDEKNIVTSRYSLWSSRGHIFAIPHDVHPAGLCYRVDLIEKLGIDVSQLKTWDDFVKVGQKITGQWEETDKTLGIEKGTKRYMIDFADDSTISLQILFTQRGCDFFDAQGNVAFNRPEMAEIIAWFVHQTRGKNLISFPAGDGQNFYQAMNSGRQLFFLTPDWRSKQFSFDNPKQKGVLALMPMPVWADKDGNILPGTYLSGPWGGSGLAITKHCKNQDLAWKFATYLYTDATKDEFAYRFKETNILPPIKRAWEAEALKEPSDFYMTMQDDDGNLLRDANGNMTAEKLSIGKFYASLADKPNGVAPRYVTAYTSQAETQFLNVYYDARSFYEKHEGEKDVDERMMELIKKGLDEKAAYIEKLIRHNYFLTAEREENAAAANKTEPSAETTDAPASAADASEENKQEQ